MAAGQKKPEAQWTTDERKAANLDQRLKSLIISVLPDDQMNSVINCLNAKYMWDDLILYHEGPSNVKENKVMDLKLCYNTFKFKEDSPDDEEDTRSSHEYLKDLEEEYQEKSLLAKSKRFFKKVPSYQSPFQPKLLHSSENIPKKRNTKDFEAKYNKVKAKLTLFSSSASAPRSFSSKNKGLIAELYDWDENEASSDDEETEIKALMALTNEERIFVGKESARNGEWTIITIKSFNLHKSSGAKESTLPNHNTDEVPSNKPQRNITDPSVVVSNSPASDYDSTDESSVCSTPVLPLEKLDGAEPSSGPKTIKSILKSKSIFKAQTLKGIRINEPSSAPARGNKSSSASKTNSAPAGKLKNANVEDDPPLAMFSIPIGGIYEEVGLNTFRNAIGAHYLSHSSEYVAPPSIDAVRKWFPMIGYEEEVSTKGTLRKSLLPPRWSLAKGIHIDYANIFWEDIILMLKKKQRKNIVSYTRFLSLLIMHKMKEDYDTYEVILYPTQIFSVNNWALKPNQPQEPPFTNHMLAICALDKQVVFKAPKTSSKAEGMYEGTKNTSYDHISAGTNPDVLADQTKSTSEGLETILTQPTTEKKASSTAIHGDKEEASTSIHDDKEEASNIIKLEGLAKLVSQIQPSFKDLDSPKDDPVIIVDKSDEDEPNVETGDTSVLRSSSPRSSHIQESTNQVLILQSQKHKLELEKNKTQVHELEIELPKELKEILTKLEDFTKTATNLTSQVAKLKTLQWELSEEFLSLPAQVASAQAKLKTLDDLPSLLLNVTRALDRSSSQPEGQHIKKDKGKKVLSLEEAEKESTKSDSDDEAHVSGFMVRSSKTKKLNKFDFVTEEGKHIHLTEEQINHQKKLEEEAKAEAAKQEGEARKAELIDLLGLEIVHKYYKQDFVTIEDFKDFLNTMLYTVQEIFFKLHQGPWLDYHARTFSSLLLAEVDKRNLNPLKQMRTIEQLRQREKDCFMPKEIKQSPLEKVLLKSAEKYIRFSLKDCTEQNRTIRSSTYDMVCGKWKTTCPSVIRFCGIYNKIMRMGQVNGAEDADYVQRVMIHYEINIGLPFKLRHCWENLKDRPKFQEIAIPNSSTGSEGDSKRHKSSGSSSFNTESRKASINLNTTVGDKDEDEV
nr:hypothetical protein [Tanacetum cinerariifolium]